MCGLFRKRYVAVPLTMQLKLCNPPHIILERRDSAGEAAWAGLYGPRRAERGASGSVSSV